MGLSMADFNAYGSFYDETTFAPHLLRHASALGAPDNKIHHAVRAGAPYLQARKSYYKLDLGAALACADPDFPHDEYRAALADLMTERLQRVPDDPAALFGASGALADVAPIFPTRASPTLC